MSQNVESIKYKFVLLGDSSVGKTAIFSRLSGKSFNDNQLSIIGTERIIVNFDNVEINSDEQIIKNFKITLFDTAGQERYRAITKSFYKDSQGIILIYSITDETSFEHIEVWLDSIKESLSDWKSSGYIVMLLGNKLDITEEKLESRVILTEEAQRICNEHGIYWGGECSAKTFSKNQIKGIFIEFIKQIYSKLGDENMNNDEHGRQFSIKFSYAKKKRVCCLAAY